MLVFDEVRLTKDAMRYGFAVGKVKVLEARALDPAAFERLLDAPTFAEQRRLLSETPYGRYLENAETAEDVERGLDEALEQFYGFLDEATLPEAVVRYFRVRHDFANFKAIAKARLLGASEHGLLVDHGTIPADRFEGDLASLPEPFGGLGEQVSRVSVSDVSTLDAMVDKAMFAELAQVAKASRSTYLAELSGLAIDLANVKILVRARRAGLGADATCGLLIDGGSTPLDRLRPLAELDMSAVPAALERALGLRPLSAERFGSVDSLDADLDAVTAAMISRGRSGPVGPEPVIAYVLERESEVVALRMLLLGHLSGLDRETLRRLVRTIG